MRDARPFWPFLGNASKKKKLEWFFSRHSFLLGVEDNVELDLWSRQLMPSQSTERKKSWHSRTRLVCDRD